MNVTFVIDNSITMIQKAYNGLSLLEIAKNYVQKAVSDRRGWFSKVLDTELCNYHLFKSSSVSYLSGYQHQELHFVNQLKYIQAQRLTDLPQTVASVFRHLNKFRVFFNCQNLYGNVEPFNSHPTLVVILTDSSDFLTIGKMLSNIKSNYFNCQYDCQVNILRISPPGFNDKPSFQGVRKCVDTDPTSQAMRQISEYYRGNYYHVQKYETGFQVMNKILNSFISKVSIKFEILEKTLPQPNFRDITMEIQRTNETPFLGKNQVVLTSVCKGTPRRTRIPLPVSMPKFKPSNPATNTTAHIQQSRIPSYSVDFSKVLDFPMSEYMPFQKLQLQPNDLLTLVKQKLQKQNVQKVYFPIYYVYQQRRILIGLLKMSTASRAAQMLIYLANFLEFNQIFQFLLDKRIDRLAINSFQAAVQEYLRKVPPVYDSYLLEMVFSRGYNLDLKSRIPDQLVKLNQQMYAAQYRQSRVLGERLLVNIRSHQAYQSECCPVYSTFYSKWSTQQANSKQPHNNWQEIQIGSIFRKLLELKKQVMPLVDDDIKLSNLVMKPITLQLSNYTMKSLDQNQAFVDDININIDDKTDHISQSNAKMSEESGVPTITSMDIEMVPPRPKQIQKPQPQPKQRLQHLQQVSINTILQQFKVSKPVRIQINTNNLCILQYESNQMTLKQNQR